MELSVEGYKSIASRQNLRFDGLTVLAGANSSGKSSFMQPFLILKQTTENHYDSGVLDLYGENAKLTDSSQIISRVKKNSKKSFSVELRTNDASCKVSYAYKMNYGLQVTSVRFKNKSIPKETLLKVGMDSEKIEKNVSNIDFEFIHKFYENKKFKPKWKAYREKCFIKAELSHDGDDFLPIKAGINSTHQLETFITHLIHVPGVRGNPERTYKIAASDEVYPGSFEKYVASIISEWSKLKKYKQQYTLLKSQLNELGLANNIKAKKVDDTSVEIQVSRSRLSPEEDCVNIADVGFGVSQTVPVLVALIVARKEQYVYIEQPELHLHPKAQFKMASIIVSAINRGVRVVVETHSSILIRGFQIAVVKKELDLEKVSLNWFTQNAETGETEVAKATLDHLGAFGDWPEDFDDTLLNVEKKYLDAIEETYRE